MWYSTFQEKVEGTNVAEIGWTAEILIAAFEILAMIGPE